MAVHSGSWSIFGQALPDFGFTEMLTGNRTAQGGSNIFGGQKAQNYNGGVLGASTSSAPMGPIYNPTSTSNTPGGFGNLLNGSTGGGVPNPPPVPTNNNQVPSAPSAPDYSQVNAIWDQMMGGLGSQADAQNQIINNSYQQGLNTLKSQYDTGYNQLEGQKTETQQGQAKNLTQLAESLRNQFMTGQNVLGARGAADSSAANQYSYALSKLGNQERGKIMAQTADTIKQINTRETELKTNYDTGVQNLDLERSSQLNAIAQWLAEQQNAIRSSKAGNAQQQADAAYQQAVNRASMIEADYRNKRAGLEQWALNQSNDIGQLKANLGQIASFTASIPEFSGINGQPADTGQGTANTGLFGYGADTKDKKQPLFF